MKSFGYDDEILTDFFGNGMSIQENKSYQFGPFSIDTQERQLMRSGTALPLPPQAVDTLLALIASAGRTLTYHKLGKLLWPDTHVEVENALAKNIAQLRKALGSENGEYIKTIHKFGYKFIAPVIEIREDLASRGSLAVLPLANHSHPDQAFFADGMTEELISHLMKIEALRVCPRTSVMAYKDVSNKPLREIAQDLKVGWVVEGSVLHASNRIRITVRVFEGATEKKVWAETYEKDVQDVLALQSEVASAIAREIRVKVTPNEAVSLAKSRAVVPEAYTAYLRGRYFWNKRTPEDLKRGAEYFRQTIDQDPTYAPAHAGLADTYVLLGTNGYDGMPPSEAMPLAKAAAKRALEIDDALAEAHTSIGYVKLAYDWDWDGAEKEFGRSIELNPAYATAYLWRGHHLMALGRLEEAAQEMQRALELEPLSIPCNLAVGWCFYYARQYDRAIQHYQRVLEMTPNLPLVLYEFGLAFLNKGLPQQALAEFQKADTSSGGAAVAIMLLGHAHARLGQKAEAYEQLARLDQKSKQTYVSAIYKAFIYAGLNEKDKAFEWFEKAYAERPTYLIYLNVEPSMDNLRSDPRYRDLLERVGLV